VPSIALGTVDLSVFEMVGSYTAFANKGRYVQPIMITRIEDKNGVVF
jgi:penicillin-binding protein 1A